MTMLTLKPNRHRFAGPAFSNFFDAFENEIPGIFRNEFNNLVQPSVNIKETKEAYLVEVAAPGLAKENFNVKVEDELLTISAEVQEQKLDESEKFTRKEFSQSSFKRTFTLPKTIASDKINAAYENGILKVTLPKLEEAKQKGSIEVKIS
jgi:HSP20 family protein